MARLLSTGALVLAVAFGSMGCSSCGSCKTCGHGTYWRNLGLPGKHPVGHSWCKSCDLCTDVGGPCGLWSRTSSAGSVDNTSSEEIIYEGTMPTASRPRGQVRVSHAQVPRKY
ncbi:hypothetical protein K2X85_03100 [bacterium]|nr:hypothetical protein [bacterium]